MSHSTSLTGSLPLILDFDGTLYKGDLFMEGLLELLRFPNLWLSALRIFRSKGLLGLKHFIAEKFATELTKDSFRPEVLEYAERAKQDGRKVYLATGASHLYFGSGFIKDLFSDVLASVDVNCVGQRKLVLITNRVGEAFEYVGNSRRDMPIWINSAVISYVADNRLSSRIGRLLLKKPAGLQLKTHPWRALFASVKPKALLKNLLIFLPVFASGELLQSNSWLSSAVAFVAMSFIASGTYLINDAFDSRTDRLRATKQGRKIASGELSIPQAMKYATALVIFGLLFAFFFTPSAWLGILAYFITAMAYTLYLKRIWMVDLILLSTFHVMRIAIGSLSLCQTPSLWLVGFSFLVFLHLALQKRISDPPPLVYHQLPELGHDAKTNHHLGVETLRAYSENSKFAALLLLFVYLESELSVRGYFLGIYILMAISVTLLLRSIPKAMDTAAEDGEPLTKILSSPEVVLLALSWVTVFGLLKL
jgi:4-hydroxybenzoate polyprenyltransferase